MSTKKKTADLSSGLVAVIGQRVGADAPASTWKPSLPRPLPGFGISLNFKVDAAFRRRFRQRAAEADLKLNELLRQALDAWEKKHITR
jgi:hypothetical protein